MELAQADTPANSSKGCHSLSSVRFLLHGYSSVLCIRNRKKLEEPVEGGSRIRPRKGGIYKKYKDLIFFNKNIIIAGICSFFSAAYVTQFYYTHYNKSHVANSILALLTEYSIYIPIFVVLFYIDNRYRYFDPLTGKKDSRTLKKDLKKLFTAFLISEIAYSCSKVSLTYQFLQVGAIPYQASMLSSLTASAISFVLINLAVFKVVKLFRK
jgi:hypothetical protein